ncbi:MAG: glycoside hydrolase domain-containing protein, partial [Bacteroidota bacterium]
LIISAATGDTVSNIYRYQVNNERCRIAFGPVNKAGTYYFYYLPYEVQKDYGNYGKDYLKPEKSPSVEWVKNNQLVNLPNLDNFLVSKVTRLESRSSFDSFYPMEVIPLASEKRALYSKFKNDYLIFPEDRTFPIRMKDEIPLKWVEKGPSGKFSGEAFKNEYYVFQIGVYAAKKELQNIMVEFSSFDGLNFKIPASSLTCFNTGGIGPYGQPFEKRVDLPKGYVQPLWIGIDIPKEISNGIYRGVVKVIPDNDSPQLVEVELTINDKILEDRGDSELWRHSRLRWLNSSLGIDDQPTKSYDAIRFLGKADYELTNKKLKMAKSGLPGSIQVSGLEILSNPLTFVVETNNSKEEFLFPDELKVLKNSPGVIGRESNSNSKNFRISTSSILESDGYINYKIHLSALNDININDIRLEIPLKSNIAQYMMGMGLPGTIVPKSHEAQWKGPYDSFWIGNTHAGLWCELRGGAYHGPLLNLFRPAPPSSWYNNDHGGFRIEQNEGEIKAVVYSGRREFRAGQTVDFEWSLLITPVKKINPHSQFTDRYYHNGGNPMPSDADLSCGVKIVNLHHANNYNPHINYPFIAVDSMKWFVK